MDAMQEDLLRRARQRSVHRTFIEAALQRAGRTAILGETVNAHRLHSRTRGQSAYRLKLSEVIGAASLSVATAAPEKASGASPI